MLKKLFIIGAGGLAREVLWLIERINQATPTWQVVGFVDNNPNVIGTVINDFPVFSEDEVLSKDDDFYFVCAIASTVVRRKIIQKFCGKRFATLIDPSVIISNRVKIGEGAVICAASIITVDIKIGNHTIVDVGCTIGHDTNITDFVTLYPNVNVSGNVIIGEGAEVGTGTQIIQQKTVGINTIIGAGSVVVRDIPDNCTAVGCPAKPIKYHL